MKYFYIIVLFVSLFYGCDMFSTRNPEEPETTRSNYTTPSTPEYLLENLKNAMSDKVTENYLSCFVDSAFFSRKFVFEPSAGSVSKYPYLAQWSLQAEKLYFNNLKASVASNASIKLALSNENKIQYSDSLLYSADYTITIAASDAKVPQIVEGTLRFSICRDSRSLWAIPHWLDIKKGNSVSWSELKGMLY
jgi:hypothetical protein